MYYALLLTVRWVGGVWGGGGWGKCFMVVIDDEVNINSDDSVYINANDN